MGAARGAQCCPPMGGPCLARLAQARGRLRVPLSHCTAALCTILCLAPFGTGTRASRRAPQSRCWHQALLLRPFVGDVESMGTSVSLCHHAMVQGDVLAGRAAKPLGAMNCSHLASSFFLLQCMPRILGSGLCPGPRRAPRCCCIKCKEMALGQVAVVQRQRCWHGACNATLVPGDQSPQGATSLEAIGPCHSWSWAQDVRDTVLSSAQGHPGPWDGGTGLGTCCVQRWHPP